MATFSSLVLRSEGIRDETVVGANTADKVGSLFLDIVESLPVGNFYDRILGIQLDSIIVPRNSTLEFCDFDFTLSASGTRANAGIISFTGFSVVPRSQGSTNKATIGKRISLSYAMSTTGVLYGTSIFENVTGAPLSNNAGINSITDMGFTLSSPSNGIIRLTLTNSASGSGSTAVSFFGTITISYSTGSSVAPFITLL